MSLFYTVLSALLIPLTFSMGCACGSADDDDSDTAGDDDSASDDDANDDDVDDDTIDDDTIDDDANDDDANDDDTGDDDIDPRFKAGFAEVDITPVEPVKMAGYGTFFLSEDNCRWSTGVHDPLYARAVAFDDPTGGGPVLLVVLDLVGLVKNDVDIIAEDIAEATGLSPDNVIVASTHTHHGPDTIGIWGVLIPPISGRQAAVIESILTGAVEAGAAAWDARVPASFAFAAGEEAALHKNIIDDPDKTIDDTMTALFAYDEGGAMLGSVMNWAAHPTVMGEENTLVSADFPGVYSREMAEDFGGVHVFVNGLLGAMIQPDPRWVDADEWDEVETVGATLADDVGALLAVAEPIENPSIDFLANVTLESTLVNPVFALAGKLGLIARDIPPLGGTAYARISAFNVGPVVFGTLPGEYVPNYSGPLRTGMGGEAQMLIGLGQDWLGYILTPDQFATAPYAYETVLCPNPNIGDLTAAIYEQIQANRR
ncbi:neutral/alkaline non-lysosomal ceramidase N-terminal domain-containing protein [bacterium]|nr:neutral/alkaline non-lysosomal ceramidase N-terminal domain-containing protein [bacterium]